MAVCYLCYSIQRTSLREFPLKSDRLAGGKSAADCRSQVTFFRNLRFWGPRLYYSYLRVGLFRFYFLKLPISEDYVSPWSVFSQASLCVSSAFRWKGPDSSHSLWPATFPSSPNSSQTLNFFFLNTETWFIVNEENWPRVPKMKFKLRQRTLSAERLILHPLLKPEDMNFSPWP